jgi:subtilisin family serine protease
VVAPGLVPPAVTPASPLIALVDTQLDPSHPEFASGNITTSGGQSLTDFHGTATAAVAAAAANGVGNLGVYPGGRALNVPLPPEITCAASARQIDAARKAGAAVINMSYGAKEECRAESDAIQRAVRAGIVPVAASGNEFQLRNPPEYPASVPHVLTVAALGADDQPTLFSSESVAVDLSAPGLGILTAVPARAGKDFDDDGAVDGFMLVDGTSFSAPMVAGAAAWVRAARPELTQDQVQNVLRFGARDVGARGYQAATGYGILSVGGALARRAPAPDPAEPNDDIRHVDGRTFKPAAAPVFRKNGKLAALDATVDVAEDPVDIYKIRLRARSRATVRVAPTLGDPDLYVYSGSAPSVFGTAPVGRSRRGGERTERILVRNRRERATTFFVAVGFTRGKDLDVLNAAYGLRVSR